ncbi:bifunctional serine/threonine protein kinase/MFS transporter [Blastopirellula sp. JC732]|uniref:non-specific serine/threonine protein kinase n=1 Tax=Blastopirellula sediminis TaxID=2894196 RepID=A0A9X1MNR4_9BACT|nr:serine/threonine-protein kinase [Blastopirellula sediminis]MCC9606546.1 bifunctional serine/threonine protein kinase/MFS transporter [Blastopirellula sediminis]MCC9630156.1 bifunctional serine/threonine protein kinase/MFS transporter [Blastopirellula sediminis]
MIEDADQRDERLAALIDQLTAKVQAGESVDLDQVTASHPDLASDLRELWGAVMLADAVATQIRSDIDMTQSASGSAGSSSGNLSPLALPADFGDYLLLEEIGRGGMGIVYRAKQKSLDRIVAVKMVLRDRLASSEDQARFRSEAEAAARIEHPTIVPIYEVGEIDRRCYFTMKYVQGETLSDRIARGPMPPRETAMLLKQVADAVHCAHQQGVLHRDLKPSNILLDESGRPLVTDFGLAKRTSDGIDLTRTGAILGTPTYMAPEQAAGNRGRIGPVSDVYSLGTILYAMLTGRPPFQGDSPVDVVLKVLEQDPPPPREINPKVDRDLEMIALRCLQKPIDLRYGSADALSRDLNAYLHDESISARSGRFGQIVSRLFRETHHAQVLENWGLLWIWHSLVLFAMSLATFGLQWIGDTTRWHYVFIWTVIAGAWAFIFWGLRRRMGPVTFVERQIAHVWGAGMIGVVALFPIEAVMGMAPVELSPILAVITGMLFFIKGGILTGWFYIQAGILFLIAIPMAMFPLYAHLIYGVVASLCFFVPGVQYYRQRLRSMLGK